MGSSGGGDQGDNQSPGVEFLFEETTDCIVEGRIQDGNPIVCRVNDAFEDVFRYSTEELHGENLNEYISPDGKRSELEAVDRAIREGDIGPREVTRQTADGPREFLFRATGGEGELSYAIYTDITAQKERERQLQRERDRLDELVSVLTHDLRNPLNVAFAHLDQLQQDCTSDTIAPIGQALRRIEMLVDDLVTLAHQGDTIGETEPVALSTVLSDSWQTVETAEATLQIQTEQVLTADRSRLRQLFANLIRNAVEHGGEDVTVRVDDLPDGFFVADNGPGIPESDRDEVFDTGYSTAQTGTGFGLSIARRIAEAHDWTITVGESADGGARFEITGVE